MATEAPAVLSRYESRLKIVSDTMCEHSKLGAKVADELAVHVLHALDTIPETIR